MDILSRFALSPNEQMLLMLGAAAILALMGYTYRWYQERQTLGTAARRRDEMLDMARREAELTRKTALLEGRDQLLKERQEFETDLNNRRLEQKRVEDRLKQREETLAKRYEEVSRAEAELEKARAGIQSGRQALESSEEELKKRLESLSRVTAEEAKAELVRMVEDEARAEAARSVRRIEEEAERSAEERSQKILTIAIERYASQITSERTVTSVTLPSDDIKGRIIGREGRNIREFERLSGVDLVIDETPQAVTLSCFDPVRRAIAKLALTKLVADGRIHPARIEEVLEKAKKEIEQEIKKAADEAAYELGIHNIRPEVLQILGRLKYRTSYSQNVLSHSVEVAHIGAMIAAEMGRDVAIAKRSCLLHDIGKAVDHEVEGPHALVGADILKRYGEPPLVVTAVAGHHGDIEQTIESMIVQVADAVSASRPGVRMESAELYIKRLESIEKLVMSHEGVAKAYAIQAGREVRVFVDHEKIDDRNAKALAKKIARKIESELSFPGQIRVTVLRETKYTEYAR